MAKILKFVNKKKTELELLHEEIRARLQGAFGEKLRQQLEAKKRPASTVKNKLTILDKSRE